jgi:serine/threonine-protein kinase HipA
MVKFPGTYDSNDIGRQEYFYSLLARQCGIEMPETQLFDNKYFGTQLFDRKGEKRYHLHSASGLLHASHRYLSLDYL